MRQALTGLEGLDKMTQTNTAIDHDLIVDLQLFIENESCLYNQKVSIEKNLQKKYQKNNYDHTKAPILWACLVESGAKEYTKQFNCGIWHKAFTVEIRKIVAQKLADDFQSELEITGGVVYSTPQPMERKVRTPAELVRDVNLSMASGMCYMPCQPDAHVRDRNCFND